MAGHFFLRRFVLFIDYQNAYMQARRCFSQSGAASQGGQFDPSAVGELLVKRQRAGGTAAEFREVRMYRGLPDAIRDPTGHAAAQRQALRWTGDPRVRVVTRPLHYPRAGRPQEKGIDVRLAVDFVAMALRGEYDIGVLMSHDTDLVPALEAVLDLVPDVRVEVVAWAPTRGRVNRLRVPGYRLWCHYLSAADYAAVADARDYIRP